MKIKIVVITIDGVELEYFKTTYSEINTVIEDICDEKAHPFRVAKIEVTITREGNLG